MGLGDYKTLGHAFGPMAGAPEFAFLAAQSGSRHGSLAAIEPERASILYTPGALPQGGERISGVDMEGVITGHWAVLFHTDSTLARSAVSFDSSECKARPTRYLATGLAPGDWQVWRNGWLEDVDGFVKPGECVLYFELAAGSFFLRRL
jgi:hypothetical protein